MHDLAACRDEEIRMYQEHVTAQDERLQRADDFIASFSLHNNQNTANSNYDITSSTSNDQLSSNANNHKHLMDLQNQMREDLEKSSHREDLLRQQLQDALSARNKEIERLEMRNLEMVSAAEKRMSAVHDQEIADLRHQLNQVNDDVEKKLSNTRNAYATLQRDSQAHIAAAQAITAERDRLMTDLSRQGLKVKHLKKTILSNSNLVSQQRDVQRELKSRAEQIERAHAHLRRARKKHRDAVAESTVIDKQRMSQLEHEARRLASQAEKLKEQQKIAKEAANSAANNLKRREAELSQRTQALQEQQTQLAQRAQAVQTEALAAQQLHAAITEKAREVEILKTQVINQLDKTKIKHEIVTVAEEKANGVLQRGQGLVLEAEERAAKCAATERAQAVARSELEKERVALQKLREAAQLEKRHAQVKMKTASRYNASVARHQGALLARARNHNVSSLTTTNVGMRNELELWDSRQTRI